VKASQFSACFGKSPKIGWFFHKRQTGEHFLEVVGKGFAVIGAMEYAVNVIENVLFCYFWAVTGFALVKDKIRYGIMADIFILCFFKKPALEFIFFFLSLEGETLGVSDEM
jgi:hypothetical protein